MGRYLKKKYSRLTFSQDMYLQNYLDIKLKSVINSARRFEQQISINPWFLCSKIIAFN